MTPGPPEEAEERRELLAQLVREAILRQPEMMLLSAFEANAALEQSAAGITLLVARVAVASVERPEWWIPGTGSLALHAQALARELLGQWLHQRGPQGA